MKKSTLAVIAALLIASGNVYAGSPGDSVGSVGPIDTEVKVSENLQFSAEIFRGKAADGTCCEGNALTKIAFDLTANNDGFLTDTPYYTFINTATNSQPYHVQYVASNLTDTNQGEIDQTGVFTSLISAVNGNTDLTGQAGAGKMVDRQFATGGNTVTIFTSPDTGISSLVQVITAINGFDGNGDKAFPAGVVYDGNTAAGTYTGQVTYSAVLR